MQPCALCGTTPAILLPRGWRCAPHTPPQPSPDPDQALETLRTRLGPMWPAPRYGTATTDPLGREGEGWHKGRNGLPVRTKTQ